MCIDDACGGLREGTTVHVKRKVASDSPFNRDANVILPSVGTEEETLLDKYLYVVFQDELTMQPIKVSSLLLANYALSQNVLSRCCFRCSLASILKKSFLYSFGSCV